MLGETASQRATAARGSMTSAPVIGSIRPGAAAVTARDQKALVQGGSLRDWTFHCTPRRLPLSVWLEFGIDRVILVGEIVVAMQAVGTVAFEPQVDERAQAQVRSSISQR